MQHTTSPLFHAGEPGAKPLRIRMALAPSNRARGAAAATPNEPTNVMSDLRSKFATPPIAEATHNCNRPNRGLQAARVDFDSLGTNFIANPNLTARPQRRSPLAALDAFAAYAGAAHGYADELSAGLSQPDEKRS